MKIEKLDNGNVVIKDKVGLILFSLLPTCSLRRDGGIADKIYIGSGLKNEVLIDFKNVTHTKSGDEETAFTGDADDLLSLLSESFFFDKNQTVESVE